jgi:hypothetical protein
MLAPVCRPIIEASPRPQLSTIISTRKPSCRCLPGASSTRAKGSAHPRSHLIPQSNLHSGVRGILRASPPRVPSLAAFGRRPPLYVAPLSLAGIRNPAQERTCAAHGSCPPRPKAEVISRSVGLANWSLAITLPVFDHRGGRRGLRLDPDIIGEAKPTAVRSAADLSAPKRGMCRRPAIRSAVNHL